LSREISKNSFQVIIDRIKNGGFTNDSKKKSLFGEKGKHLQIGENRMDYRSAFSGEKRKQDSASLK
jgi:hypothetical protein